jgi:sugar phosphate isomerase/epimerase
MLSFEHAVGSIAKAGFDGLEVMVTGDKTTQDGKALKDLAGREGLSIGSVHAPFLLLTRGVFSSDPIEKIKRSTEVAHDAGADIVVVHPPYRWQTSYARWLEDDIHSFCAENDIKISMENMFPVWVRGRGLTFHKVTTVEDMTEFDHVTLDTSHLGVSGIDVIEAFRSLKDSIAHIHLSNNLGTGRDSHSPLQTGVLPIGALLEEISRAGFAGSIALEMDVREHTSRPAELVRVLAQQVEHMRAKLAVKD